MEIDIELRETVLAAIYEAIDELNQTLPNNQQLVADPNTQLFGQNGRLDSLGLVNFITEVEQVVEDRLDTTITLADEKALSQKRSPFQSVDTLATYVLSLLKVNANS